jgi:type I restriction enzyme M protein
MVDPNNDQGNELIDEGIKRGIFKIEDDKIIYPNGKSYNFKDPEEKVRAKIFVELVIKYLYPIQRLDTEVVGPRREPKLPADIVVYEDDDKGRVFIVVETKAESTKKDIDEAKREGLGNANLLHAKYLLVACASVRIAYNLEETPSTVDKLEKYRVADIPVKYGKEPKFRFKRGDRENDLRKATFKELDSKFHLCHDEIWEGGKRDPAVAFDEFSKLLIAKLYDERFTPSGEHYKFQIGTYEEPNNVAERIRGIYKTVQQKNSNVFNAEIELPDSVIFRVVGHLQDVSLRNTDLDAKGRAFENFLGKLFRGEYGQYFTPRQIVEFMVEIIDPDEDDYLIDPACGSGGFLLYSMKHVLNKVAEKYREDKETIYRLYWDFSHDHVFGIEINDRIARVAMMDMVIHEDGHSNIECNDALEDYSKFDPRKAIKPGKYDVVLTNPPFGKRIRSDEKSYFKNYTLTKNKKSEMSEILFIERCLDLAKEGGKIGIVLPDSAFTNKSNIPVVEYLLKRAKILAIISVPQHTFIPYGSMSKTSLVFLEKKKSNEKILDYFIFLAHVEHIGYDATRREDKNDLHTILDEWTKFKKDPAGYPVHKELTSDSWISKVNYSHLKNKLDVEAYSKEYVETLEKISRVGGRRGYSVLPLSQLCLPDGIFAGVGPKKSDYKSEGIPIIKTATIKKVTDKFGVVDWGAVEYVDESKYSASKKFLHWNDILIQSVAHSKEYVADKIAILDNVPKEIGKVLALSKFLVVRPDTSKINPHYLLTYLSSNFGRNQINHFIRGMTAEVYEFDIKNILVIVPPEKKQEEIANTFIRNREKIMGLMKQLTDTIEILNKLENEI